MRWPADNPGLVLRCIVVEYRLEKLDLRLARPFIFCVVRSCGALRLSVF
jgi:hypothetical protein